LNDRLPFGHSFAKIQRPSVDHESTIAVCMNCTSLFSIRIDPCLNSLQDKQTVFVHRTVIHHVAFDVCQAFGNQWSLDVLSMDRRQLRGFELVDVLSGAVSNVNHLGGDIDCGNGNDAFLITPYGRKTLVPRADDAADLGSEIHYHMPTHRHNVGFLMMSSRYQNKRPWFYELKSFGKFEFLHFWSLT
jgi:hypothetical protein